jgi:long-chain acyl-CoA synthetase
MNYPYENLENFTLPSLFNRSVDLYSNEDAFGKVGESAMKYSEVNDKVQLMVALLQANGITKGDKVLLLSENMPNWGIAYFAVTYFGAVIVPVLPDFHPAEVHHIMRHSEAKAVFVSQKHQATIEECEETNVKFVINLDELKILPELSNPSYLSKFTQKTKDITQKISNYSQDISKSADIKSPINLDELTNNDYMSQVTKGTKDIAKSTLDMAHKISNYAHSDLKINEDDLCAIIYTSGTTGHSKGVMLSHKNLVTNALSSFSILKIEPSDVFLSILPLAHTYECTVGLIIPVLHGSSIYYIDRAPTPSILLKAFAIVKPTFVLSVPLVIEKIYKNKVLPKFRDSFIMRFLYMIPFLRVLLNKIAGKKLIETFGGRIRFFAIGGAALSPFVEKFLIEANFPYTVGYGLTETAPLLAGTPVGHKPKFKSTGPALYGVQLKIQNIDSQTGEGEIIAKSPSVMMGYYKDKEKTKEVMKDGWFLTGDLGHMDNDGYLYISGRSKNVLIGSGGENIYPEQIESIINQNEFVLDSIVMQQNDKLIARVHLDYELLDKKFKADKHSGAKVKEEIEKLLEGMRVDVNSKVSSFSKMVKFIEQIEPFIKTPTKKIKRFLYEN